jgi:predicted lipid-binding transport protein (Tim44 family)
MQKMAKYAIIATIALVVSIFVILGYVSNWAYWGWGEALATAFSGALAGLYIGVNSYGLAGQIGFILGIALIAIVFEYVIVYLWNKRKAKKQPTVAQTINMQRDPSPEQQPMQKPVTSPIPASVGDKT